MNTRLLINQKAFPNNFDFIRYVLAASVILCHSYLIIYGPKVFIEIEPFLIWSKGQISIGSVAVNLFFVISGFLIVKSFESSTNYLNYLSKRVLRIFPGFIVAFLLSILVAGFIGSGLIFNWENYSQYFTRLNHKKELIHLFTLRSHFQYVFFKTLPERGLNVSLWTIQYEFICYLLVPLFALLAFFKHRWAFFCAFLLAYLLLFLQGTEYIFPFIERGYFGFSNPFFYPRFITYFLAGACFFIYRDKIIRSNILFFLSVVTLVLSFTWIKCVDQVMPLAGTYLVFHFTYHSNIKLWNFAKYGDFSYGVYLYAWPVQQLIMYYFRNYLNPYSLFLLALLITTMVAFLSWHLIEKPFLQLKKKQIETPKSLPIVADTGQLV